MREGLDETFPFPVQVDENCPDGELPGRTVGAAEEFYEQSIERPD